MGITSVFTGEKQKKKFAALIGQLTSIEAGKEHQWMECGKTLSDDMTEEQKRASMDNAYLRYLDKRLANTEEPLIKRHILSEKAFVYHVHGQLDKHDKCLDDALNINAPDSTAFHSFCRKELEQITNQRQPAHQITRDEGMQQERREYLSLKVADFAKDITTSRLKSEKCRNLMRVGKYDEARKLINSGKYIKFNSQNKFILTAVLDHGYIRRENQSKNLHTNSSPGRNNSGAGEYAMA